MPVVIHSVLLLSHNFLRKYVFLSIRIFLFSNTVVSIFYQQILDISMYLFKLFVTITVRSKYTCKK